MPERTEDDSVEMVISRCLTDERPKVLVQTRVETLRMCLLHLGSDPPPDPTESKSKVIKRMLVETDKLRNHHANLVNAGESTCQ